MSAEPAGVERQLRVAIHAGQLLQPVPGGIGSYVLALLRHLPSTGITPIAFGAGARPDEIPGTVDWVDLGIPRGSVRYELWNRFGLPAIKIEADLVHAPSLAVPPVRGRPLAVTVHDIAFLRFPSSTTRRGVAFHTRALARARKDADVVLAPTEFTRSELLAEGFDAGAVVVSFLGCEPPAIRSGGEVSAAIAALGVSEPYVVTVGTIEPRKRLPLLARAFARVRAAHRDLSLVIAGPRGWGDLSGLDLEGVRVLGRIDDDALDALYRRAVACCLPSVYEGFGLPAVEAMARGCPIVVPRGGALAEVAGDAAVLVDPDDVDSLSDAITSLATDATLRGAMSARGHARATRFSWQETARGHAAAYGHAIGRAERRHRAGRT